MRDYSHEFGIEKISKGLADRGYYRLLQAPPSKKSQENKRGIKKREEIPQVSRRAYGRPRVHADLQGERYSRKGMGRFMRKKAI